MENKDKIVKYLAYNGKVSVTCAITTHMVEKARNIHDLSPTATAALGRTLTIASIIGADMKNKSDNLTIQIKGDGPLGNIIVVSDNFPKLKAYVQNPLVDIPLKEDGKLDVGSAVGKHGFLSIIKDIGLKDPYTGMIPLQTGEIAEDFTKYFAISEQKPCVVALGVLVNSNGVKTSGGYVINLMPDITEEEISKLEENIKKVESISSMLEQNRTLEEIAKIVTNDENIELIGENKVPIYTCDCNIEKMERALISIGKTELEDIIKKDKKAEIKCHFCNKKYNFDEQQLKGLLEQ